jgi:asparagine synthase (glutamine-hydrolysing)
LSKGERCGTFLSGGTDSSTITGLLGATSGAPAQTFSIGFDAEGYDEMVYARIAARHFGAAQHEYYVTPGDVVDAIPRIADTYDQPFGNASAVPTYYCAKLAHDSGMSRMLGGDGGDELYGGNARYAKQRQFAFYERIPPFLRHGLIEPVANRLPLTGQVALLRKARSYVAQASMPMPERYDSYNLLERLGAANVLTADFLAGIDTAAPARRLREIYGASDAQSLINRMLALDFQITLADNDLPKVTRMCELAKIDVAFPMLHDDVIDFSLRLPPGEKLRGNRLRHFFKEALKDFLPPEVIAKQKHGFGLPVGVWLQGREGLRTLAGDTLATLRGRQIVRADFIDRLLDEHLATHAGYYGTMVWILMMLELWFQRHLASHSQP